MSVTVTLMEDTRKQAVNTSSKKCRARTADGRLELFCLSRLLFHARQEHYSLVVQFYFCFPMQVKSKVELNILQEDNGLLCCAS
jgi:hypothetical protein